MTKRFLPLFLLLILLAFASSSFVESEEDETTEPRPWFKQFTPVRTFYVSTSGNGDGKTAAHPMNLKKAMTSGSPGDLFWVLEGTYSGDFRPKREGTEERPIVFRAEQGKRVVIEGGFSLEAANNWVWGFEITDRQNVQKDGGVEMLAAGTRAINNVIHDQMGNIGIGAWQQGKGQVIYGNIVYRQIPNENNPHNLYIQNDYDSWGYKYVVNNVLIDSADANEHTFNVHAYTEGGLITGLWFEKNVIRNGKFLVGGFNAPADHEVVKENYFYRSHIQFGYRRPTQVRFQNNYVARTPLLTEWVWGAGETQFRQTAPSVYTFNELVYPPGPHLRFSTSAYLPAGRCEGCPRIRSNDIFDENKYSAPFRATFFADSNNMGIVDLPTWRRLTAQAGKGFDANSVEVPAPKNVKTVILENDYDPMRAHLVIYNWSPAQTVTVNLGSYLPPGSRFAIYDVKQAFQAPILAGIYSAPVQIPSDREFRVFLITRQ
jgi:hypothetical protein